MRCTHEWAEVGQLQQGAPFTRPELHTSVSLAFYPDSFNQGLQNHRARAPSIPFTYAPGLSNPS